MRGESDPYADMHHYESKIVSESAMTNVITDPFVDFNFLAVREIIFQKVPYFNVAMLSNAEHCTCNEAAVARTSRGLKSLNVLFGCTIVAV